MTHRPEALAIIERTYLEVAEHTRDRSRRDVAVLAAMCCRAARCVDDGNMFIATRGLGWPDPAFRQGWPDEH